LAEFDGYSFAFRLPSGIVAVKAREHTTGTGITREPVMRSRKQKLARQTFLPTDDRWREVMRFFPTRTTTLMAAYVREAVMNPLVFDAVLVIGVVGYVLLLMVMVRYPL
jgi:hypothetical protein